MSVFSEVDVYKTSNFCPSLEKGMIQRREWVYLLGGEGWTGEGMVFNDKHCDTENYSFIKSTSQDTFLVTSWGFFLIWGSPIAPLPPFCNSCALTITLPPSLPLCRAAHWLRPLKWNVEITSPVYTAVMLLLLKMSGKERGMALLHSLLEVWDTSERFPCSEGF